MKLFAPESYWNLTDEAKKELTEGGCGPGGFGDWLVPDTVYGLSIRKACQIHDACYALGETIKDKKSADRTFLNNMLRIIYSGTKWWILRKLRIRRAYTYYKAVKLFGGHAFWHNKNSIKEYRETK